MVRTSLTTSLGAGVHPKQVQEMLGHADVSIMGKALFHKAFDDEDDFRRHRLDLLLSREDLPLEDWIDTDDQELLSRVAAVFDRIEEQLQDKELPPPPDRVADPG